jgi:TP901 family phage tail tape measure protein
MDLETSKTAKSMTRNIQMIGAGIGGLLVGAATLGPAFAMAKTAGDFSFAMKTVQLISQATEEQMKSLRKEVVRLASATIFDPEEATKAMIAFAQAGFGVEEQLKLLEPTLEFAQASLGQLSPEQASGLAIAGMRTFGKEAGDIREMLDKVAKITMITRARFGEMPAAMGILSRGAQRLKVSLDDTLLMFGLVKNVIPGTERAATTVTRAFEVLSNVEKRRKFETLTGVKVTDSSGRRYSLRHASSLDQNERGSASQCWHDGLWQ